MSPAAIGRQVGNYRFDEKIGEGGVGEVYRATDLLLDRTVAIKALRADLAARGEVVERFRAEAQTLAQLNHPNIAILYSLLLEEEELFMVMEFVSGRTFADLLKQEGSMRPDRALPLFFEALDAIGYAHERGFVHRDVKAANVMLDERGQVKVMDFGIARALGSSRATEQGHLVGTLPYMSPEQIRGEETDARADIYSLGVLLFHLLTGRVPFARRSDYEVMRAHVELEPPPLRNFVPGLSPELEAVVLRALAKDPGDRFGTTGALREALEVDAALEVLREPTCEHGVTTPAFIERTLILSDEAAETGADSTEQEITREHATVERRAVSGDAPTRRIQGPEGPETSSLRRRLWRTAAGLTVAILLIAGANLLWIGPPAPDPAESEPEPELNAPEPHAGDAQTTRRPSVNEMPEADPGTVEPRAAALPTRPGPATPAVARAKGAGDPVSVHGRPAAAEPTPQRPRPAVHNEPDTAPRAKGVKEASTTSGENGANDANGANDGTSGEEGRGWVIKRR